MALQLPFVNGGTHRQRTNQRPKARSRYIRHTKDCDTLDQVPFAKEFLDETRGLPTLFREGIHV